MKRASRYRDRVTVERETETDTDALDDYGNPADPTWGALGAFWADMRETTGRERVAAGRLEAPATATVRLRRSAETAAITAADRVQARGQTWAIVGAPIDPDGSRREVEFTLERGGAIS